MMQIISCHCSFDPPRRTGSTSIGGEASILLPSSRIVVITADCTTSLKTLATHSIQSINLTADKTETVPPDGIRITGQATFTRSNGTTGTVADASLNYDPQGHAVAQMAAANANGTLTVANMHRRAHRHARMIPYGADQQDSRLCRSIAEAAL